MNGLGARRRLFADDAEQGIAFVEMMVKRFDVLLMNPPFGDATPAAAIRLENDYPATRLDLFAAFCERLLDIATPEALIGAITPRDGFFKKTLTGWRELILKNRMPIVADLGIGVLDAATVRVATYILGPDDRRPHHCSSILWIFRTESVGFVRKSTIRNGLSQSIYPRSRRFRCLDFFIGCRNGSGRYMRTRNQSKISHAPHATAWGRLTMNDFVGFRSRFLLQILARNTRGLS